MKKIVRLTESDLIRLVKKVIKEQDERDAYYAHGKSARASRDKKFSDQDRKWLDNQGRPSDPDDFDSFEDEDFEMYYDYDDFDQNHPGVGSKLYGDNPKDQFDRHFNMDKFPNPLMVRRHKRKNLD